MALGKKDKTAHKVLAWPLIGLIKLYQYGISPLLGPKCRFYPSCSNYALQALKIHGPFHGGWLALKRISKCHPLHPGGIDEVPGSCQCDSDSKTESPGKKH